MWEGGTRGTSLLFAPRDLGYASENFRNLWVFWVWLQSEADLAVVKSMRSIPLGIPPVLTQKL